VAIVFKLREEVCRERNRARPDRDFGPHVIRRHVEALRRSLPGLRTEGFRYVYVLNSPEEVAAARVVRQPLWTNRRDEHGPFDIIGDVHGCWDELRALLEQLGWEIAPEEEEPSPHGGEGKPALSAAEGVRGARHPAGRKAIF